MDGQIDADDRRPDGFDAFMAKHRQWMMRLFERQFGKVKLAVGLAGSGLAGGVGLRAQMATSHYW